MISLILGKRWSPIGVDLGTQSVKLVQLSADRTRLVAAARCELPTDAATNSTPEQWKERTAEAIRKARESQAFRGRDAVICLHHTQLTLQSIRLPRNDMTPLGELVQQEAAGRLPFPPDQTELRFVEAAEVRQGEEVLREIVLMACDRRVLQTTIELAERAGLRPVAVDVEPTAIVRSYAAQFRREQDQEQRSLIVHIGHSSTAAVIAKADQLLFVKYIRLGGQHLDEAVARSFKMELADAAELRRDNGDRRSDRQDPAILRGIAEAVRPVLERLTNEISLCIRYHNVTFRGQSLVRIVLSGAEGTPQLLELLGTKLGVKCELSDPFRKLTVDKPLAGRLGQWDIALGLAMRKQT